MNAAVAAPMPAGARRDVLLGARALTKNYGGLRAVNAASLDLYRGEIVALVGDNGAGKSTFIKMLSGVIVPDSGSIVLHGREVHFATPAQARAAGIETLHPNLALADVFDVAENAFLGRELTKRRLGLIPVLDLILERRARGFAVLIISHNLERVFSVADRICVWRRRSRHRPGRAWRSTSRPWQ